MQWGVLRAASCHGTHHCGRCRLPHQPAIPSAPADSSPAAPQSSSGGTLQSGARSSWSWNPNGGCCPAVCWLVGRCTHACQGLRGRPRRFSKRDLVGIPAFHRRVHQLPNDQPKPTTILVLAANAPLACRREYNAEQERKQAEARKAAAKKKKKAVPLPAADGQLAQQQQQQQGQQGQQLDVAYASGPAAV